MEKIEFGYSHGYTAALMRIRKELAYLFGDLKLHKRRVTQKEIDAFMKCAIDNRAELRDNPFAFIRCNNSVPGGFEIWEEDKHRRRMYAYDNKRTDHGAPAELQDG